jgi:hypothetical protein
VIVTTGPSRARDHENGARAAELKAQPPVPVSAVPVSGATPTSGTAASMTMTGALHPRAPPPPPALHTIGAAQSALVVQSGTDPPPMHIAPIWHVPPPFEQQIMPAAHGIAPLGGVHGGGRQVMGPPPMPPPPPQMSGAVQSAFEPQTGAPIMQVVPV